MTGEGTTRHSRGSSWAALRRLGPYTRPVRWRMFLAMAAVLGSMTCGLMVPLVIQRILDGPVAHKDTSNLLWLILGVAGLGATEAILFFIRRRLTIGPATQVEANMRSTCTGICSDCRSPSMMVASTTPFQGGQRPVDAAPVHRVRGDLPGGEQLILVLGLVVPSCSHRCSG